MEFKKDTITVPQSLLSVLFVVVLSILLAYLEIQIEGKYGWARNLPTWRRDMNGFVWTGYHVALWSFLLVVVHIPFLFTAWTGKKECFVLSFLVLILLLEDTFWFLMNKDFCGDDHWRQPKLGPIPRYFFIGSFFILLMSYFTQSPSWVLSCLVLLILMLLTFPFQVKKCVR
jgi:hypothetical protein